MQKPLNRPPKNQSHRYTIRLIFLSFIILLTMLNLLIEFYHSQFIFDDIESLPKHNVGLVLGAAVHNHRPSQILKNRLDNAILLYQKNRIKKILVSGDNTKKKYREVDVMKDYLIKHQIRIEDILTHNFGINTLYSISYSKYTLNLKSVTIITQRFHLSRSLFLAHGMELNAHGYSARGFISFRKKAYYWGREFLARYQAIWNILPILAKRYMNKTP